MRLFNQFVTCLGDVVWWPFLEPLSIDALCRRQALIFIHSTAGKAALDHRFALSFGHVYRPPKVASVMRTIFCCGASASATKRKGKAEVRFCLNVKVQRSSFGVLRSSRGKSTETESSGTNFWVQKTTWTFPTLIKCHKSCKNCWRTFFKCIATAAVSQLVRFATSVSVR